MTLKGDAPNTDDTVFESSTNVFVYYYKGASGWGNLLAGRPTVMLGADGSVSALSFAAWAVRSGLVSSDAGLDSTTLADAFESESSECPGLVNGAVYAFGGNLTEADRSSLLDIIFDDAGTPIVVIPAVDGDNASFVSVAVEGKADLADDAWTLDMQAVSLFDATRAGYTPIGADGYTPATAYFRLRMSLNEGGVFTPGPPTGPRALS